MCPMMLVCYAVLSLLNHNVTCLQFLWLRLMTLGTIHMVAESEWSPVSAGHQEWGYCSSSGRCGADSRGYGVLTMCVATPTMEVAIPIKQWGFPQALMMLSLLLARTSSFGSPGSSKGPEALVLWPVGGTSPDVAWGEVMLDTIELLMWHSLPVLTAVYGQTRCWGGLYVVETT